MNIRIAHLLATSLLLHVTVAKVDRSDKARQHHRHHLHSPKTWHNLRTFEGDIVPEYSQILECYGADTTADLVTRGILKATTKDTTTSTVASSAMFGRDYYRLWPERIKGVTTIPYEFDKGAFNATDRSIIETALRELSNQLRVVQFVPSSMLYHHLPHLLFKSDKVVRYNSYLAQYPACWTHVGWQGTSYNVINLEGFCISPGFVKHELLHTLGVWHLTSRWDRDDYVTVAWENIFPGLEYCFRKRVHDDTLGFPYYDYDSIMNNDNTDFAKYGSEALLSPKPIGQIEHLSAGDVLWIRLLYQCRSGPRTYDEYLAHPCTEDCPCWQGDSHNDENAVVSMNCHGKDAACQGSLVCSPETDRCSQPGVKISIAKTMKMRSKEIAMVPPRTRVTIGLFACLMVAWVAVVLTVLLVRAESGGGYFARRVRRQYETIP